MATIHDNVYDNGLAILDTYADRLDLCSQEPTTYAEATSTYTLGCKTTITVGSPEDGATGRKVAVSAISAGSVSGTNTATHFALTDVSSVTLMITGALAAPQAVTSGNEFTLTAFDITLPDPA